VIAVSSVPAVYATLPYTSGDLLLGVRAQSGTGAGKSYLINIGSLSTYANATNPTPVSSLGNVGADLTATFGSNWKSRSDLFWSVTGANVSGDPTSTLYVTRAESPAGNVANPWKGDSPSGQSVTNSKINALIGAYINGTANGSTPNGLIQDAGSTNAYASFQPNGLGRISYDTYNPSIEASFANGSLLSVLDLFKVVPVFDQPATRLGFFRLDDGGALTYYPAASGNPVLAQGDATVAIQSATYSQSETGGQVAIKLVRSGNALITFSVNVSTTNGTALAGTDFTNPANTVTIAGGQSEATVNIPIANRTGAQGNRTFTVNIANPSAHSSISGLASSTVTITEDAGTVAFQSATYAASATFNGQPNVIPLTVVRSGGAGGALSVDVAKTGGTILPAEFQFTSPTTVTFANGETSKSVDLTLKPAISVARTAIFTLSNLTTGTLGSPSVTTVNIAKKDVSKPAIVLSSPGSTVAAPGTFGLAGTLKEDTALSVFTVTLNGAPIAPTVGTFVAGTAVPFSLANLQAENGTNTLVLTATDTSGNTTVVSKSFTFKNVDLGASLAGIYNGVLVPSGTASNDTSGFATLTVTPTATFTGKVTLGGITVAVKGLLNNAGVAKFSPTNSDSFDLIDKTEFDSYLGALNFSVTPGSATGTLKTAKAGSTLATFSAPLTPYTSANPAPASLLNQTTKGVYSVALASKEQSPTVNHLLYPQGDGVGTLTLTNAGVASLKGNLADGTAYSLSGRLTATGTVAVHTNLYKKAGSIAGVLTFANAADSDVSGTDLLWIRPAQSRARYYPAGWTTGVRVDGIGTKQSNVVATAAGFGQGADDITGATPAGNSTIVFTDGALTSTVSKGVNINETTGKVTLIPVTPVPTSYKVTFGASSGAFGGFFTHTDGTKPVFKAVLLNKGGNKGGFGYFLSTPPDTYAGSGQGGGVSVQP